MKNDMLWPRSGRSAVPDPARLTYRPVEPSDAPRLERLLGRLSPETVYRRFFQAGVRPSQAVLRRLATVDHNDREAIVALDGDEIVGVARYDRSSHSSVVDAEDENGDIARDGRSGEYEVAVVVEDAWQRHGVGRLLLNELSARAAARDIDAFVAVVLADNEPVRRLIASLAPGAAYRGSGGERDVVIPLRSRLTPVPVL